MICFFFNFEIEDNMVLYLFIGVDIYEYKLIIINIFFVFSR